MEVRVRCHYALESAVHAHKAHLKIEVLLSSLQILVVKRRLLPHITLHVRSTTRQHLASHWFIFILIICIFIGLLVSVG